MSAVEVKNLTFFYPDREPVLHEITFEVSAGEALVIAGLSGSGKTTLCNILSGVIPHAIKGSISGHITVMDIDPRTAGLPQTALRAGLVFQDADSQIISTTVEDELAFGLENLCIPPEEIRLRVDELLFEFGFTEMRLTNPVLLSGGQKKLLTIAAVLAPSPPVLLLDEPMSCLDSEGRTLVRTAIEQQRDKGRAIIIVEHDLNLVTFADKWLILKDGTVVTCGAPSDILSQQENLLREAGVWE
jgi:energy-coupling factor transport system ATP-binding protein